MLLLFIPFILPSFCSLSSLILLLSISLSTRDRRQPTLFIYPTPLFPPSPYQDGIFHLQGCVRLVHRCDCRLCPDSLKLSEVAR